MKKFASLKYFELGEKVNIEIKNLNNSQEKKGLIMVASQLYFYAGETGLKYLLKLGNYPTSREDILAELEINEDFSDEILNKLKILYLDLLPFGIGGKGLRNFGAYQGKNSKIYEAHKEFANFVIKLIKIE